MNAREKVAAYLREARHLRLRQVELERHAVEIAVAVALGFERLQDIRRQFDNAAQRGDGRFQIADFFGHQFQTVGRPVLGHWRIDQEHSNAYARWLEMGSPQPPTPTQVEELEFAGKLETLLAPAPITIIQGRAVIPFRLPRQGVSLITLTWREEGDPS